MHSVCAVCDELNARLEKKKEKKKKKKKKRRKKIERYEKDVRKKFRSRADKGDEVIDVIDPSSIGRNKM